MRLIKQAFDPNDVLNPGKVSSICSSASALTQPDDVLSSAGKRADSVRTDNVRALNSCKILVNKVSIWAAEGVI